MSIPILPVSSLVFYLYMEEEGFFSTRLCSDYQFVERVADGQTESVAVHFHISPNTRL